MGSRSMQQWRRLGVACVLAAGTFASLEVRGADAWITGTVADLVSRQPLAGCEVRLIERVVVEDTGGGRILHPLAEDAPSRTQRTGPAGEYRFLLPLDGSFFYGAVAVESAGYLGQVRLLVIVAPDQVGRVDFALIRENEAGSDEVAGIEIDRRVRAFQDHPEFEQKETMAWSVLPLERQGDSATGSYSVPELVYVTNLAGSGFTGMIPLDDLIAGTVTAEEGDGFPFEALKAQAVAARTFALDRLRRRGMANGGQAYTPTVGVKSRTATLNTSRIVLLYGGAVFPAYFSARCNGDFTLNGEEGPTLSNCRVGGLGAGVVPWARSRPCSGHVNCAQTTESCCVVVVRGRTNHIYGHGIGMCQRGAQQFAGRDGHDWERVLKNFYTGITVANLPGVTTNVTMIAASAVSVRAAPCGNFLTSVPVTSAGIVLGGPERPRCSLASPNSYLTWWDVVFADGQRGWVAEDFLRIARGPTRLLRISRSSDRVVLSWPASAPELVLESAPAPGAGWTVVTNAVSTAGGRVQVEEPAASGARFYRLRR